MTGPTTVDQRPVSGLELGEDRPQGTAPVRLVLAVEGIDTSDGRHILPGALSTRPMPLTIWAQVKSTHGIEGGASTFVVGAITDAERVEGPTVLQRSTGQPFPVGTFVWIGKGWMYTDVPGPATGSKPAYELMRDGALYGNSVDLTAVDASFEYEPAADPNGPPSRIVMHEGVIGSTTLVGIPAFMDAFVESEGQDWTAPGYAIAAAADALVRGVVFASFRAASLGDDCVPCTAQAAELTDTAAGPTDRPEPFADLLTGEDLAPAALDFSTSGMVALIPVNPEGLAVPGGDPADQLHLTLAYLGEEVNTWSPEDIAAVHRVAREATDHEAQCAAANQRARDAGEDPIPCDALMTTEAQQGPLVGRAFAHAVFNPNGGPDGQEPATVYLLEDTGNIGYLASQVCRELEAALGSVQFPEQHRDFVPHVTAGYNLDPAALNYTGPIAFDRMRVAIGNQRTDYPLGGGTALVADGAPLPPLAWFEDPQLDAPTPITVTDDGRVFGHLCLWGTCHTSFTGQCVQPPRSTSSYAYFTVHVTRAADEDGEVVKVPVGYGTLAHEPASGGHAGIQLSASEAARHYDNTCTAAFELAAGEDEHGVWVAGRLMPGLEDTLAHKARGVAFSGDWRTIRGNLELVAALGVNTPGFPVPRARVAAGTPVALVAAGMPAPADSPPPKPTRAALDALADALTAWVNEQRAALDGQAEQAGADLEMRQHEALADITLTLDGDHPWFHVEQLESALESLADLGVEALAGRKVLHLPPYIKRIEKHLLAKGMSESRAIATAVNAAKRMCATGDLNFPGSQQVNPGSRAQACAAVAQWKKDRPGAR